MSPSIMNVSAARRRIRSSLPIRFSYIARARSSTSHAALKSSSGSASSPSSPSPSPASSSASASASGLDASANKSTAGSSSSSSASPENDRILLVPFVAGSMVHKSVYKRVVLGSLHAPSSSCFCCCCSFPRTEFCTMAFSNNAFPYAKYTSAISGASSACVCDLARF